MLVIIGAVASVVFFNLMSTNWEDKRALTVNENVDGDKKIELVLGQIETIVGSQTSIVELRNKHGKTTYSSGENYGITRNILFIKNDSVKPAWLFKTNQNLIKNITQLTTNEFDRKEPTIAIMYQVVYEDSDSNNKIDNDDKISVAISDTEGTRFKNIISSVDAVIDHKVSPDGKTLDVIYQSTHKVYIERFSLDGLESVSKAEITQIGS